MNIAKACIRHKVTTILATIMVVIFGVMYATQLQLALMPDMEMPMAVVMTTYVGATPSDIEELVTDPLEAAIMSVSGIDSIISDKRSLRNTLVAGTTLALAVMLPYHCASTYSAWAKSLPAFLNMLCTSTVFIAVVAGVLLNLILNYVLKDKNEK